MQLAAGALSMVWLFSSTLAKHLHQITTFMMSAGMASIRIAENDHQLHGSVKAWLLTNAAFQSRRSHLPPRPLFPLAVVGLTRSQKVQCHLRRSSALLCNLSVTIRIGLSTPEKRAKASKSGVSVFPVSYRRPLECNLEC